jgi:hypothetical protein
MTLTYDFISLSYRQRTISLFIVYLTTLFVAQIISRKIKGWYVNDEFESMWKEAVVAIIPAFAWRNWEKPRGLSITIDGLRAEILTLDLPNTKQEFLTTTFRDSVLNVTK